jgi:phage terminase large subunit-like protein
LKGIENSSNPDDAAVCSDLYWRLLLIEARHHFLDSYLLYLEKNRRPKDKFYAPKRKCFIRIGLIQALQDLIDDKLDLLSISMPPGTGKTTLLKFFHSAVAGWYPEGFSLFWTHSDDIARMYYDGVYDIVANDIEYTWHEIFPDLEITKTNAKMEQFNVGAYKPFPSVQCTSTGAKNAGKVRANQYLIVDDMIGSIEEALNKTALDKLWTAYTVNAMQRKVPRADEKPCKEIHCATRWSVNDVIGRLERAYEDDPRARFIAIPDVDPKSGRSNFRYEVGGFSEHFFQQQALLMDEISYRCLYKQDPVEREGLLYTEDELRYYVNTPDREPDAILAVCDTKSTGTDWMVMPVLEQYGTDYYLVAVICDDSTNFKRQYRRLADCLIENKVQQCEFEANAGGSRVAFDVGELVEEAGHYCNITSKTTLTNKETRIMVNSDFVKANVLFKDKEYYTRRSDYGKFMSFLLGYSIAGKNKHDDVPDAMAAFALFVQKMNRLRPATIMESPI